MAEAQAVADRKARRGALFARAGDLVDHLALADADAADITTAAARVFDVHVDAAKAQLADGAVAAAVAAHAGVTQRHQAAGLGAGHHLQGRRARGREFNRLAGDVDYAPVLVVAAD